MKENVTGAIRTGFGRAAQGQVRRRCYAIACANRSTMGDVWPGVKRARANSFRAREPSKVAVAGLSSSEWRSMLEDDRKVEVDAAIAGRQADAGNRSDGGAALADAIVLGARARGRGDRDGGAGTHGERVGAGGQKREGVEAAGARVCRQRDRLIRVRGPGERHDEAGESLAGFVGGEARQGGGRRDGSAGGLDRPLFEAGVGRVVDAELGVEVNVGTAGEDAARHEQGHVSLASPLPESAVQLDPVTRAHVVNRTESGKRRSEERRVGKECRSRWSPYH